MRRFRILALAIALVMMLSTTAFATNDAVNPKGVFPIVKEGETVELTIFVATPGLVSTFDAPDNLYTQWLEEQTGLKLHFVTCSQADEEQKVSLLLNTNDYPDIIFTQKITTATAALYAAEGVFIPLNDLYEEYGDNLAVQYEEYPLSWDRGLDAEGNLICLTNINDCLHCNVSGGRAWYYQPFMKAYQEATGKEVPQTTAEYKDYLIWIRDNDVNGNGDTTDEIPLATFDEGLDCFRRWAANSFLPYPDKGYAVVDGKYEAQFLKDEFRDSLRYVSDLYNEGLILKDSFTITKEDLIRVGESEEMVLASAATEWNNDWLEKFGVSGRFFYSWLLPTLAGPEGVQYTYQIGPESPVINYAFITDKCKNPDAAFRLIDFMKSFEGTINGYIGPKGVCWDEPDEGALGINGEPALYKLLVNYGVQPMDAGWDQTNADYRSSAFRLGEQATGIERIFEFLETGDPAILEEVKDLPAYNEAVNYYFAEQEKEHFLPAEFIPKTMILSEDESTTVADIEAVLNAYLDQAYVEFATGVRDINDDAAWETYVNDCLNMGVQTICDIYTSHL